MRNDVDYSLDENLRSSIIKARDVILDKLYNANVYLFGSISKGRYSKQSDIDLLVIIDENKSTKELRLLRHEIEDAIDDIKLEKDVDIKLYSKIRYDKLCKTPCFEQAILEDLVNIGGW
ncbi:MULTISPECIES: nucleotidyltransferase domain-containing protein [Clostridium]|uniref:Nucleotidyltransferase domain-containing protein n=1 Tax=Clostridium aquiflavi TaxID=3073603 RepID=A0ABU1EEE5_9CLOT|nr:MULTISPECIES: nucleotidyltransferase domain-containing protein [unclassified Clostridium]MDR5586758.1 nucleotidyltransferase domain-containing protein [Clostridium sp. 5N-1]NFG62278.1 DNA polymerase beta [Clostridium botulinum]NFQ09685.1 DNA polymerase beta [Clostridium botulinum]